MARTEPIHGTTGAETTPVHEAQSANRCLPLGDAPASGEVVP